MILKIGYGISSLIFLEFFGVTLAAQIASKRYHPAFYWAVLVATTTVGTTTSDYLDRTLGLGYVKSSIMLFRAVIAVLVAWHYSTGEIAVDHITTRKNEIFYWVTILVSNTLGTAMARFRRYVDRAWFRARGASVRGPDRADGCSPLLHQPSRQRSLLGRLRPKHGPSGRHCGDS
jgi:uncharacterized membrane-anchored protein